MHLMNLDLNYYIFWAPCLASGSTSHRFGSPTSRHAVADAATTAAASATAKTAATSRPSLVVCSSSSSSNLIVQIHNHNSHDNINCHCTHTCSCARATHITTNATKSCATISQRSHASTKSSGANYVATKGHNINHIILCPRQIPFFCESEPDTATASTSRVFSQQLLDNNGSNIKIWSLLLLYGPQKVEGRRSPTSNSTSGKNHSESIKNVDYQT